MNISLQEFGEPVVVELPEETGDLLARSGVVNAIRLGNGVWQVSAANRVGVASIGGVTVWIQPKVSIHRILFMLGYAKDPGWRVDDVGLERVDDLIPVLAQAFADQVERALLVGAMQGYVEVEDSLTVLRGRIREQDQLRQRFGMPLPLLVRYDDYSVDIPENQILKAAIHVMLRLPGVDSRTRTRFRHSLTPLAEVASLVRGAPRPSWRPNRLNSRYQVAIWLAELILDGDAVDQTPGSVSIGGFIVDMAKVYEDFLTVALTEALRRFGGRSRAQDSHYLDVDNEIRMKPDLVWYLDSSPAAVIDAKYKAEKPAGFPDADQYQMLAYCTALGLNEGHLVYAKGNAERTHAVVRNAGITIQAHTIDLELPPRALLERIEKLAAVIAA